MTRGKRAGQIGLRIDVRGSAIPAANHRPLESWGAGRSMIADAAKKASEQSHLKTLSFSSCPSSLVSHSIPSTACALNYTRLSFPLPNASHSPLSRRSAELI